MEGRQFIKGVTAYFQGNAHLHEKNFGLSQKITYLSGVHGECKGLVE
ncbi:MAG: hypothetical protein Q8K75_03815 [Chlamydiales bacterium]|nr:hypothetical protein [Chlamydiales bacterium]